MTGFAAGVRAEEMSEMRQGTVILKSIAQLDQMFGETVLTKDIVQSHCVARTSACVGATASEAMQCLSSRHNSQLCSLLFGLCVSCWHEGIIARSSLQSEHTCWLAQAALLAGTLQLQRMSGGMWQTGLESAGHRGPTHIRRWEHGRVIGRPLPSQLMTGCSLLGKPHMQASTPACKLPWRLERGQPSRSLRPCSGDGLPSSKCLCLASLLLEQTLNSWKQRGEPSFEVDHQENY